VSPRAGLFVGATLLLTWAPARGEPSSPLQVDLSAPDGCADEGALRRRVEELAEVPP
jgi:hypothetical protein